MADLVRLHFRHGEQARTSEIRGHEILPVGRAPDCRIRLTTDPFTSRHHCLLEVRPPLVQLRDLGSANGTWVNDEPIGARARGETPREGSARDFPSVALADGDVVRIGQVTLRVEIVVDAEQTIRTQSVGPRCAACGRALPETPAGAVAVICEACREAAESALLAVSSQPYGTLATALSAALSERGYRLGQPLGQGSYGVVCAAESSIGPVAVKLMFPRSTVDPDEQRVFEREVEALAGLNHAHVVRLLAHGTLGAAFYFVFEYCSGGNLADYVQRRGGRLDAAEATELFAQAAAGLAHAHELGLVHRDLKPANILLAEAPGGVVAKLADFGLAKSFVASGLSGMTVTGAVGGTYRYMPREQLANFKYVRPWSDVWSLAASFYAALTGAPPRDETASHDPLQTVLEAPVVPLAERRPDVPAALAAVFDRALADPPDLRYNDAVELLRALPASGR